MKKKKVTCRADIQALSADQQMKYEIAEELGLLDQVLLSGWDSLSSGENGKIGGMLANRTKFSKK